MAETTTSTSSTPKPKAGLPIGDLVSAGTAIASTIAQISDMNKRRRFEENLALLSNRQQQELNEKLLAASTQTERLEILSSSMVTYLIANEKTTASMDVALYIVAGCLAVVVLGGAIYYAVKNKN
jgi:hypothetical protein